jgi:hypothetical protein
MIRGNEDLSLPILLAGPILRRAEPERVCIWIACSKPVTIRAEIFKFIDLKSTDEPHNKVKKTSIIGIGSAEALRLGEHLYVGLVTAHPIQEDFHTTRTLFPTDELLAYDIELSYKEGSIKKNDRLNDFGLLNGKNTIVYKGDNDILLPTFFLRGQNTPLNILYGSCRKLHGKGEDCLVIADELVATSVKDLKKRPSVLFLIGDQIYADDVAGPLIQYLSSVFVY